MKAMKVLALAIVASAVTFVACQKEEDTLNTVSLEGKAAKPWNMISYKGMIERLEHYDKTRKPVLEQALGFEDTRINYYSIETIENYIKYVKQLSKEKGIELTGINFVSGAYPEDANYGTPNYQHFMFMPTTNVNGKNVGFDPMLSTKDKVVTIKEMLASFGYNWVYDSKEDYENRNTISKEIQNNFSKRNRKTDLDSGAANVSNIAPPYH
ncbi:hypothetical protein [Tenacibaculum amylolyticum]|uniref:hypothetical protein n=1 Tax=Tenacibaculum amylolyticum TaxID=104269 RepID=UPI003893EF15